jgi:hypothetical protein
MTEFAGRTRTPSLPSSPQRTPRVRPAYAYDSVLGLELRDVLTLLGILCGFAFNYGLFSARLRTQEELLREVRTKLFNGINAQIGALQTGLGEMKAACHARHEEKR